MKAGEEIGEKAPDSKTKQLTAENIEKAERALIECVGIDKSEYELKRVVVD